MELTKIDSINESNAIDLFNDTAAVDGLLTEMREIAASVQEFDLNTTAGRKECASAARKFATAKSKLDGLRKSLVEPLKKKTKKIDASGKRIRDTCDELRDLVRQPLTDYETAERERMEGHRATIEYIISLAAVTDELGEQYSAFNLKCSMDEVEQVTLTEDSCHEYLPQYIEAVKTARNALKVAIPAAEKREQEAAELEELRKLKAESERAENERQIAAKAVEDEQARKRQQDEFEAAQKAAEEAKRLADREHISRIRSEAKESLVKLGVGEIVARQIILAINAGEIANVTINY